MIQEAAEKILMMRLALLKMCWGGNSLVVQSLGLGAFTAWGPGWGPGLSPGLIPGLILGCEIKIPKAMQHARVGGWGKDNKCSRESESSECGVDGL